VEDDGVRGVVGVLGGGREQGRRGIGRREVVREEGGGFRTGGREGRELGGARMDKRKQPKLRGEGSRDREPAYPLGRPSMRDDQRGRGRWGGNGGAGGAP